MNDTFIITGTDTDIGKTVFAAMLAQAWDAMYWKPVQSGVEGGIDTRTVQRLSGLPDDRFFPEAYILSEPLSPHHAAEIDGIEIDMERLTPPDAKLRQGRILLIEGAGGLMVPITRKNLQINMFKKWNAPVILCARTALGTINHTLLSIEALKARDIDIHGIAFIGDDNPDTIRTIAEFSGVPIMGRLPYLHDLTPDALLAAYDAHFGAVGV